MKIHARQDKLVEIVRMLEKVSVEDLAQALGASRETIRRDLTQLAKSGKVQKIHGGATRPKVLGEGSIQKRLAENIAAKIVIAKTAAALVKPDESLFVDTGSTTLYFAEELSKISGLTVITNSTEIARTISAANNGSRVFLLGGEYSAGNSQTVGTLVTAQIKTFRAHHAFLTIGALDIRSGAMDFDIEESQVARAMISQSEKLTILADPSKFKSLASFEVCPLARIDRLVCESLPPAEICDVLDTSGGQLILPDA